MLGAIVATTDPVAVIAIFRDIGAPTRLTRLVGGESLLPPGDVGHVGIMTNPLVIRYLVRLVVKIPDVRFPCVSR